MLKWQQYLVLELEIANSEAHVLRSQFRNRLPQQGQVGMRPLRSNSKLSWNSLGLAIRIILFHGNGDILYKCYTQ